MELLEKLLKDLQEFARKNDLIKEFLGIFKGTVKWEDFKNKYCGKQCRIEDKLKKDLENYLKEKYVTNSEIRLCKKFFERDSYVDLSVRIESTFVFIELKLNYPGKESSTSAKAWGYEEFIALKEKIDLAKCAKFKFLILFIVDTKVKRKLNKLEKQLLTKAENTTIKIIRVFLNQSNNFEIEII